MNPLAERRPQQGFTLVEILIVILLFAIFMGAVYSLYVAHMRTAFRQDEVVDVQQNLRVAMDTITRDLQMAGFLAPGNAINSTPTMSNFSSIGLNMASASHVYTRLTADVTTTAAQSFGPLHLATAAEASRFANVSAVRIIRPRIHKEPYPDTAANNIFRVDTVDLATPSVTLRRLNNSVFTEVEYRAGDMICKLDSTASTVFPETVRYGVIRNDAACGIGQSCLRRQIYRSLADSRTEVVAQNIVSLKFGYLIDDGSSGGKEVSDPNSLTTEEQEGLRAVRVTITGQTMRQSHPGETPAIREMTSIVRLRNRR